MAVYSYIRVSSKDQNEDRQLDAIEGLEIDRKNIYIDKQSGKDFNRPQYMKLRRKIKKADLVLQLLAYVAEIERSFIKQRQAEGIAVARKKGVKFGRKRIMMPKEFDLYFELWKTGRITGVDAAKNIGISKSTFYRRCKEMLNND